MKKILMGSRLLFMIELRWSTIARSDTYRLTGTRNEKIEKEIINRICDNSLIQPLPCHILNKNIYQCFQ